MLSPAHKRSRPPARTAAALPRSRSLCSSARISERAAATAASAAPANVVDRLEGKLPPPGLYGPFATADFAFWNGDFTLDYNQEANFWGAQTANHPELILPFLDTITYHLRC